MHRPRKRRRFPAFQLRPRIQKSADIERVAFAVIGKIPVVRVIGNIALLGMEGTHAADLQNALVARHDGDFVERHQFTATLSMGKFK